MTRPVESPGRTASVLDRLLEAEAELDARLAAARREADALVAAAQAAATDRQAALEAELRAIRADSAGRVAGEVGGRLRALEATRDGALGRLDRIRRERTVEFASWLAGEVVAGINAEAEP